MANEDKWTPDKPLSDAEAEKDAEAQAQFKARRDHLYEQYKQPPAPAPRGRRGRLSVDE